MMKNVLKLSCIYESILKNIKIKYYAKLIRLYQTINYGKFGRNKAY